MGRVRWRAVVTTSVVGLGVATLGACSGSGSPGAATVTVTAAGRSSAAATPSTSLDAPGASSSPTSGPTTAPPTTRSTPEPTTSTPRSRARLRISHRVVGDSRGLKLPEFTVEALTDDATTGRAARALQRALEAQVSGVVADWEAAAEAGSKPQGSVTTERVSVPVNEAELAVVVWRASVYTGGAHPLTVLRSVTVDVAHGRTVTDAGLLGQLQQAGGPAWDFERELRRAVTRQVPEDPEVATLTRDELHVYPTRTGLHGTGDQCVLACALPPLEVTIPWDRLVGAHDDIEALPDAWGL